MAFRAAFLTRHTRSLTEKLYRKHNHSSTPLLFRSFSYTPILFSSSPSAIPYPVDSLVADVIDTNEQLEANPPQKRRKRGSVTDNEKPGSVELPPIDKWPEYFPWTFETKGRCSLTNSQTAKQLAETHVPEGARDQIIVEAFPGPGVLTRALLELPKERIKKLIVLEDHQPFYKFLKPLEAVDPRVTVVPLSGYTWGTYDQITSLGLLDDVYKVEWHRAHMQLKFISHIPTKVHGEQLVSQFFRNIPDRQWLFKYGRVPLHLIMTHSLWDRVSAPAKPDSLTRCKLSVIAEATANFKYTIPPEKLLHYNANFYPFPYRFIPGANDMVAVSIWPLEKQHIEHGTLDEWDYILRRLFVQRATPLKKTIPQLAPGAKTLLNKVTDASRPPDECLDTGKIARTLTAKEWKILADAFINWPFKPDDLSIDSFHLSGSKAESKKLT